MTDSTADERRYDPHLWPVLAKLISAPVASRRIRHCRGSNETGLPWRRPLGE